MRIKPRIKMGFKLLCLSTFTLVTLNATMSDKQIIRTEVFDFNKTLGMNASANAEAIKVEKPKVVEQNIIKETNASNVSTLNGSLTGYAADCKGCSGRLGCLSSYNVYKNNVVTYPDKTYGNVRIVASSKNLACGSIVKFNNSKVGSIYAIVLDRGVSGNNLDLLVESESVAVTQIGRSNVNYSVIRRGW